MNNDPTSPAVSAEQAVQQAQLAFKANRIYHLEGRGGGGKTSILVKNLAEAMGIPSERVFLLNMSGMGPQEMLGYGIVDDETRDLYFSKPEQWPHRSKVGDQECLIVLDEFTQWEHASMSLCRGLVQTTDGIPRIGTHELGSNVHICMTSNRACDGSRSAVLDAPFVSRALTNTLEPTLDGFLDWAAGKGLGLSPIYTFLKYSQGLNERDHFNPPLPQRWDGAPHPTPRSWEAALLLTSDNDLSLLDDHTTLDITLRGLVGQEAGAASAAFCSTVSDYIGMVDDIRAGTTSFPPREDPAKQYAVAFAALRQAKTECKDDPQAYISSGSANWLVDKIILDTATSGEFRSWGFRTACAVGIPLELHNKREQMQGI